MKQYVVDAFTDEIFKGNPTAVCIMENWIDEKLMQKIAVENNLSETAFAVKDKKKGLYKLRWFTPGGEVELCGHATLATAFIITRFFEPETTEIIFDTLSGLLSVTKNSEFLTLNFPSFKLKPIPITQKIINAIGTKPQEAYIGADIVCVLKNEEEVRNIKPNFKIIQELEGVCFHVTARGKEFDCITRSFAPKCNVAEDPVCGRAHCHIIPLWTEKLKKINLTAYQASSRGGILYCRTEKDRTIISGKAVLFSIAEIFVTQDS